MPERTFTVRLVGWDREGQALSAVRRAVFVEEQGVPEALEWDGLDPDCEHAAAFAADGRVVGTARLLLDGHIGRVAVLKEWRGAQIGVALMRLLIESARERGFEAVHVNAQTTAMAFYQRLGFQAHGGEFLEAGIRHRGMTLPLAGAEPPAPAAEGR
jgi:predicted GNAT family N-acyltransferase